ncbi:uncharacterized protein LOC135503082 [Lineus longissimus]|uniref:uncharacterized protein LOC135503082 n=1 Tax=Lineus longissimus TaxID=88925 RepID=UPI002B4EFDCE
MASTSMKRTVCLFLRTAGCNVSIKPLYSDHLYIGQRRLATARQKQEVLFYNNCRPLTTAARSVTKSGGRIIDFSSDFAQERIRFLCKKLNCTELEAKQLINKYPRLITMADSKITSILGLFADHSISKEEILTYPEVFSYSVKTLIDRFKLLEEGLAGEIKLVTIKDAEKYFSKRLQKTLSELDLLKAYGSKSGMVMSKLGCMQSEAEKLLETIQSMTLSKLESKLDCVLNKLHLPPNIVLSAPWLLHHSSNHLEQRNARLKDVGLTHENCEAFLHLLMVEKKYFEKRLEFHIKEREALGECKDLSEYLCLRLECSDVDLTKMTNNFSKLLSVSAAKVKEHLDFLLTELHLPARDVMTYPRVLRFATGTIRFRYKLLFEKGIHPELIGVKELQLSAPSFKKLLEPFKGPVRPL